MTFKRFMMVSTSTLAATLFVHAAAAQTAQPPAQQQTADNPQPIETVVVTGVRASVQGAREIKRNAAQIQDSVVAEDIGKFPDNNAIEALQHVTGITISRDHSETNQLLIRGLPDIATLLNGREIFTSTGRFVTLQDIPAELLARVDVQKSSTASDLEGGIAGLVDIHLHRPFDFDGLEIAGGVQGTYSSLSEKYDFNGSGLISDRWRTSSGEFGFLVDLSYRRDHYQEEILDNYIYTQSITGVPGSTGPGGLAYIPLTQGAQNLTGTRERTAADVAFQWKPNEHTEFFAEGFYTRYRNPNSVDFFVGLPWINADASTATVFPGTDLVKTVTGGNYDLTSNQSFVPKTDTYQLATGGTWTGDRITLSTELDYTNSKFTQTGYILDTEYYPPGNGYTADFNYHGSGTPFMQVTGIDLTDPANFHMRQFYDQWTEQKGNETDWRGDLSYDLGTSSFFRSIDAGVRYANRFAGNVADNAGGLDCRGFADPGSPQFAAIAAAIASPACFTALNDPSLPGTAYHVTHGTEFDGKFGIRRWLDADPNWLVDNIGFLRTLFGQSPTGARPPADPTQTFDDREISYAGYAKANFAFNLGSIPVDGNVGLRVVETDSELRAISLLISSDGAMPPNYTFTYTPTDSKAHTTDWLPSLNVRFLLQENLALRFAASQTVTHPTFAQLNPALSLSNSTATLLGSGTSGNPDLSPVTSQNVDLSLEYYFGSSNLINAAVFYRKVDGYIQNAVSTQVIGGISYGITSPVNAPSGHIDGVEAGYTQFFDFLPGWWSGFGLQANATFVEGQFQFISKWSANLVGIYERGPVSIRLAYDWRTGFNAGGAPPGGQQPQTIFAKSEDWLNLSINYQVTSQFAVSLDATNLLDTKYQDAFGSAGLFPRDTRRFDQTVVLGLRYRM